MGSRPRDVRLDALKGLCMFLVVFGHLQRLGSCQGFLEEVVGFIYTFHMPVFVLVSGFLFAAKGGTSEDVKNILSRILKPYFVIAFLMIPFYWAVGKCDHSIVQQALDVFRGNAGGALWFLYELALIQIIACGCLRLAWRVQHRWLKILIVSSGVLLIPMALNLAQGHLVRIIPFWFSMYFVLGYVIGSHNDSFPVFPVALLGLVSPLLPLGVQRGDLLNFVWVFALVQAVLIALGYAHRRMVSALAYCGRHTLAILLFHPFFNPEVNFVSQRLLCIEPSGVTGMVGGALINVGCCLALEIAIRKSRFHAMVF